MGGYICANPISSLCSHNFDERKSLEALKKDVKHTKHHKISGKMDKNAFIQVTEFIIVTKNCLFENGDIRVMSMRMCEKKLQYSTNKVNNYFKPEKKNDNNMNNRSGVTNVEQQPSNHNHNHNGNHIGLQADINNRNGVNKNDDPLADDDDIKREECLCQS